MPPQPGADGLRTSRETLRPAYSRGVKSSGESDSSASASFTGIWYFPDSHRPRSISRHRSEQNGNGDPFCPAVDSSTGFLQMGHSIGVWPWPGVPGEGKGQSFFFFGFDSDLVSFFGDSALVSAGLASDLVSDLASPDSLLALSL